MELLQWWVSPGGMASPHTLGLLMPPGLHAQALLVVVLRSLSLRGCLHACFGMTKLACLSSFSTFHLLHTVECTMTSRVAGWEIPCNYSNSFHCSTS